MILCQSCKLYFIIVQVQNKAPAPIQITAEQLLREAKERELEQVAPVCKTKLDFFVCS